MQEFDPGFAANVPASQSAHEFALSAEYVPAEHVKQLADSSRDEKVPAEHDVHATAVTTLNVPFRHLSHDEEAERGANFPPGQFVHDEAAAKE